MECRDFNRTVLAHRSSRGDDRRLRRCRDMQGFHFLPRLRSNRPCPVHRSSLLPTTTQPRQKCSTTIFHPFNNHVPTTSQPSFGSNTRTTRFRLNHPASMILQTKPLSNLIPTSTKKTGARSSVQSPLQAKCRASSTQRSRSRVTFVILPATPRPVPSKNRQMFNS